MTKTVSISAIADLHGHLPQLQAADLAVVCGDIFPGGLDKDPYAQGVWFKNEFLPWVDRQDLGSKELRKAVEARNIRFLVGGHIHETRERIAHMDFENIHTEMANVACCDNFKQPFRLPICFTINVEYISVH